MRYFTRKDYLISVLIILISFSYFSVGKLIPDGLMSVNLLGFEIGSFGFIDFKSMMSFIRTKLLIILFSSIWFLTSKHWWKISILVLIIIEIFKLCVTFFSNSEKIDVIDFLISLPITIPFVLLLFYISHKLNSYNLNQELREKIDLEIDKAFFQVQEVKIHEFEELKKSFEETLKKKKTKSTKDYLNELISIRNKFYKI